MSGQNTVISSGTLTVNGVLTSGQGAPASAATQLIQLPHNVTTASVTLPGGMTAGQIYLFHFYLPYPLTINTIYTAINFSGTAGHLGVGIYTEAGNLQTSATTLLSGFGVQTSSPTQITLSPGWY